MGKKMHPADLAARERIAAAEEFSVFLYRHQARIMEHGYKSFADAVKRAAELEHICAPKLALIYAISEGTSIPIPRDMWAALSARPARKGPTVETATQAGAAPQPTEEGSNSMRQVSKKTSKKKAAAAPAPLPAPDTKQRKADEELLKAMAGKIPAEPDFSKPSRERYRAKLKSITALIKSKDVKGLKGLAINPVDSANKIMARYRDHAVIALEAKA